MLYIFLRHAISVNNVYERLNPKNPRRVPDPTLSGSLPTTAAYNLEIVSPKNGFEESVYLVQFVVKLLEKQKSEGRKLDIEVSPMLRTLLTIKPSLNYLRTQQVGFHINELIHEYGGLFPGNLLFVLVLYSMTLPVSIYNCKYCQILIISQPSTSLPPKKIRMEASFPIQQNCARIPSKKNF